MKNTGLLMAMLAMGAMDMPGTAKRGREYEPKPTPANPTMVAEQKRRKGLKCFYINGHEVWAMNEKNAIRKANKRT